MRFFLGSEVPMPDTAEENDRPEIAHLVPSKEIIDEMAEG